MTTYINNRNHACGGGFGRLIPRRFQPTHLTLIIIITIAFLLVLGLPSPVKGANLYQYVFKGVYNEETGLAYTGESATIVCHWRNGSAPTNLTITDVQGGTFINSLNPAHYFIFDMGTMIREYWLPLSQVVNQQQIIYVMNSSRGFTTYEVNFLDLAGSLKHYPYISFQRYVNGSLYTVAVSKVDEDNKIEAELVQYEKYNILLGNGGQYTYGEVLFNSDTEFQLIIKPLQFPQSTILTYKYVRIYGYRYGGTTTGNITINYHDLRNDTNSVTLYFKTEDGTTVHTTVQTLDSFSYTWLNAENDTGYYVYAVIDHGEFGEMTYKQYFLRYFTEPPWGLDFLGSLPFDTHTLLPMLIILFVFGAFSVVNAYVSAFFGTITTAVLVALGWVSIRSSYLVVAFGFAIIMGLGYLKRRVRMV